MVKIISSCPHCHYEHELTADEKEDLTRYGKVVISDCKCNKYYKVEQDTDGFFTTK